MKFYPEQWQCGVQLGSPPGATLWSQCSPQASCPGGKPLAHCKAKSAEPAAGSAGVVLESGPVCREESQQQLGKLLFQPAAERSK